MSSYLRTKVIAIGVFLAVLIGWYGLNLFSVIDTDFGWHYRCGQDFLTTGEWCQINRYSYLLPNYYWGYSTLIYDVLLVILYDHFGFFGVMHLGAVIMTGLGLIWYWRYGSGILNTVWIFLAGAIGLLSLGFRAQGLTIFYAGLFWALLPFKTLKPKEEILVNLSVVALLFVWANSHPGVALFLGLYGLFCLLKTLQNKYQYVLYGSLAIFVSLLTVAGFGIFSEAYLHYHTDLSKLIFEWTAPSNFAKTLIVLSLIVAALTIYLNRDSNRFKAIYLTFSLVIIGFLTFSAKRQIPLFSMLLFVIAQEYSLVEKITRQFKVNHKLLTQTSVVMLIFFGLLNWSRIVQTTNSLNWYCNHAFVRLPCRALVRLPKFEKRLFTSYEWGGFLIWQRRETKVFVDGRMPAWKTSSGESPYTTYLKLIQARPGWRTTLKNNKTDALLIPAGTFLDLALMKKPGTWKERYRDNVAAYYTQGATLR